MKLRKTSKILALLMLSLLISIPGKVMAAEITLKDAISQGFETNSEIRELQDSLDTLHRELKILDAEQDWQIQVDTTLLEGDSVDLSVSKSFSSGLTLTPEVSWLTNDNESSLFVEITQPVYPFLPSDWRQQSYTTEQEITKVEMELEDLKAEKALSWLESYLTIIRLAEKETIYSESVQKAETELAQVQKRLQLGDAGTIEELTAKVSLQDAKYKLQETENQLAESKLALKQELGLGADQELAFNSSNQYLSSLDEQVEGLNQQISQAQITELISIAETHSSNLLSNRIDNQVLEKELQWLKQEGPANLDLTATHNTETTESTLGLSLSYQLYDGGKHELELESKQSAINSNQADYDSLLDNLKLQLTQLTNEIELGKSALEKQALNQEKAHYEAELAEEQLKLGLIDYLEYQDYWIASKEAIVSLSSLQDQLLLSQLKLFALLGGNLSD